MIVLVLAPGEILSGDGLAACLRFLFLFVVGIDGGLVRTGC
jgi:hypothetical protein